MYVVYKTLNEQKIVDNLWYYSSRLKLTCPKAVCLWSLRDVLPAVEAGLVAEGLEVLHDLPHVLDRHDDEARGAEEEEAAGPGQAGRHGTNPADLSTSFSYFTVILHIL